VESKLGPLGTSATSGLLYLPRVIVRMENRVQGKPKYSEKTYPSATFSTTNPTSPDPGSNPGRRGGKPATNLLSYGAVGHRLNSSSTFSLNGNIYLLGFMVQFYCQPRNLCCFTVFKVNLLPFIVLFIVQFYGQQFNTN
jgi:hypothetical protein